MYKPLSTKNSETGHQTALLRIVIKYASKLSERGSKFTSALSMVQSSLRGTLAAAYSFQSASLSSELR